MTDMIQKTFDYGALEESTARIAQAAAIEIHAASKRCAETIMEIGKRLSGVKAILPHGSWLPWIEAEFGWTDRTARNFVAVYEAFKSENISSLTPTVLYMLAAPSTPEPVREVAVEMAKSGEKVTPKTVERLKEAHKQEKEARREKEENHLYSRPVERDEQELSELEQEQLEGFDAIEGLKVIQEIQYGGNDADGKYVILFRKDDKEFRRWFAVREDFTSYPACHMGWGETHFEAINRLGYHEDGKDFVSESEGEDQGEEIEPAEFEMIPAGENLTEVEEEDDQELQPLEDEQLDPHNLTFVFLEARERCSAIAKSKKIAVAWANYTPRQAAFVLQTIIRARDWHNQVIEQLERLAGEEIDAE